MMDTMGVREGAAIQGVWRRLGPPADLKARILEEAAGNPLALIELPAASANLVAGATGELLPLSERLEQAFAARLPGLPPDTRRSLLLSSLEDGEILPCLELE